MLEEAVQIPEKKAKSIIVETLDKLKKEGRKEVDVITLHLRTSLPFPQINKVMDALEKEGKVRAAQY